MGMDGCKTDSDRVAPLRIDLCSTGKDTDVAAASAQPSSTEVGTYAFMYVCMYVCGGLSLKNGASLVCYVCTYVVICRSQ